MSPVDYDYVRDEVTRRMRLRGRLFPSSAFFQVLTHEMNTIGIYLTRIVDPIDALVDILCDILPYRDIDELNRRMKDGDSVALMQAYTCLCYGLCGMEKDEHKTNSMIAGAIDKCNARASACMAESAMQSCTHHLKGTWDKHFILDFKNIQTDEQKGAYYAIWPEMDRLCACDYVCPVTLLIAGQAAANSLLFNDSMTYTKSIKSFLERHPEAVKYYYRCVSLPCDNDKCEIKYSDPGVTYDCDRCSSRFCCNECRDIHKHDVHGEQPPSSPETLFYRPLIEHMLCMFGIYLDPDSEDVASFDSEFRCSLKLKALSSYPSVILEGCADAHFQRGGHYNAVRLYSAVINKIQESDKTSPSLPVLLCKRAQSMHAIGHYRGVLDDCHTILNQFDTSRLDGALVVKCQKLRDATCAITNYHGEVQRDDTIHSQSVGSIPANRRIDMITAADTFAREGRRLPAIRLYTAVIDSYDRNDYETPVLCELFRKRATCRISVGLLEDAQQDCIFALRCALDTPDPELNTQFNQLLFEMAENPCNPAFKTMVDIANDAIKQMQTDPAISHLIATEEMVIEVKKISLYACAAATTEERMRRMAQLLSLEPMALALFSARAAVSSSPNATVDTVSSASAVSSRRNRRKKDKRRLKQSDQCDQEYVPVTEMQTCSVTASMPSSSNPMRPMHAYTLIPWNVLEREKYAGCVVCCLEVDDLENQNAVVFQCKHALCSKCMCQLVKKSRDKSDVITSLSCPLCRAELPSNILTVVAKQFIVDDHSAVELQSLAESMHLKKPDEVCVSLITKNSLDVTSTYSALFVMARMMAKVDADVVRNVLEHSTAVDKLDKMFNDPALDVRSVSFVQVKQSLQTSKASLQDAISQAIKGCNCQPVYNNNALIVSFKGFDLEQSLYALHYVLLPILPVYGRTSINDIDSAIKQKFTDAIPPHVRHETRDGVMTLKSL